MSSLSCQYSRSAPDNVTSGGYGGGYGQRSGSAAAAAAAARSNGAAAASFGSLAGDSACHQGSGSDVADAAAAAGAAAARDYVGYGGGNQGQGGFGGSRPGSGHGHGNGGVNADNLSEIFSSIASSVWKSNPDLSQCEILVRTLSEVFIPLANILSSSSV
ncbi:spidroin-1-like [Panonychus citri]|uniref:spidroin-1-like n=1 Tax=Panonychus citri TaxID=50023 RepID=UPI002307F89E|nr:spidroin-1-like [Panonychus citri]